MPTPLGTVPARRHRSLGLLVVLVVAVVAPACVRPPPPGGAFVEEVVYRGLTQPTAVRFAPDGRVFVAEKSGIVKVFDSLTDTTPTVFADLRTEVYNYWDRGLLGLADIEPDVLNAKCRLVRSAALADATNDLKAEVGRGEVAYQVAQLIVVRRGSPALPIKTAAVLIAVVYAERPHRRYGSAYDR